MYVLFSKKKYATFVQKKKKKKKKKEKRKKKDKHHLSKTTLKLRIAQEICFKHFTATQKLMSFF